MSANRTERAATPRGAARLFAVQALFQQAMEGGHAARLIAEFANHRFGQDVDGVRLVRPDADFFGDLVAGVLERDAEIATLIADHLAPGWTLDRLDRLVLQTLRAGAYELIARPDIPTAVIISEYVDVAGAFVERAEQGFVNGVLDRIARTLGRKAA